MTNPLLKFYILIEFLGHKQSFRNGSIEACNFFSLPFSNFVNLFVVAKANYKNSHRNS